MAMKVYYLNYSFVLFIDVVAMLFRFFSLPTDNIYIKFLKQLRSKTPTNNTYTGNSYVTFQLILVVYSGHFRMLLLYWYHFFNLDRQIQKHKKKTLNHKQYIFRMFEMNIVSITFTFVKSNLFTN